MKLWQHLPVALLVLVFPVAWCLFAAIPLLDPFYRDLQNMAMDWRFQVRGPLKTEVPVVYANIDARTIDLWGEQPFPRHSYATFIDALIEQTGASVVGVDMVLSPKTNSELVDARRARASDRAFAQVLDARPEIVLAGQFSGSALPPTLEERADRRAERILRARLFPVRGGEVLPSETYPEVPGHPLVNLDDITEGRVGLIDWNTQRSGGGKPRYLPLFADVEGPWASLNQLDSYLSHLDIPRDHYDLPEFANPEAQMAYMADGFYVAQDNVVAFSPPKGVEAQGGGFLQLEIRDMEHRFFTFSLEIVLRHLGLGHEHVEVTEERLTVRDEFGDVVVQVPLINGQEMEINWFSPWHDISAGAGMANPYNPQDSIATIKQHLINARDAQDPKIRERAEAYLERFEGAIVMIGPTDPLLQDLAPTPFDRGEVPKVSVHGNAVKTMLSGEYLHRLTGPAELGLTILATFGLTAVVAGLGVYSGRGSNLARVASAGVFLLYVVAVFAVFSWFHFVLPLVAPAGSAAMAASAGFLYQLTAEERRRNRIKGLFGTYLPREQVEAMAEKGEEPSLGGEECEITAFFSDVQNFSSFSEALSPADLQALMNEYLGAMTDILFEEQACLDKYIGDAIVAFFNAPVRLEAHALHACRAAAKMQLKQAELREKWQAEGDRWPEMVPRMRTRIGLNTGPATVGNMGSAQRMAYTMMGDTVNLAARCESGAKSAGVYSLVSGATMEAATAQSAEVVFRFVDRWRVKGRSQPVDMFEIVGLRSVVSETELQCVETYEAGLQAYFRQDFVAALQLFGEAEKIEPLRPGKHDGVANNPSLIMLERCTKYKDKPPGEGWDGVYTMTTK
ncbi:MAG: CHASE2 domain-containing protein [Opitutales bacterium]